MMKYMLSLLATKLVFLIQLINKKGTRWLSVNMDNDKDERRASDSISDNMQLTSVEDTEYFWKVYERWFHIKILFLSVANPELNEI